MQLTGGGVLSSAIKSDPEYGQLLEAVKNESRRREKRPLAVSGLCDGATELLITSLIEDLPENRPVLLLCPEERICLSVAEQLKFFGIKAEYYPGRDLNTRNITASHDFEHRRISVLMSLVGDGVPDIVITTPDAAVGITMPPEMLKERIIRVKSGDILLPTALAASLVRAGYKRSELAEGAGQYAVRGGIIDICTYAEADGESGSGDGTRAYRIEFFGDEIDRICIFDPATQRVTENTDGFVLPPAFEIIPGKRDLEEISACVSSLLKKASDQALRASLENELSDVRTALDTGSVPNFADRYISLINPGKTCLLDYLESCPLVLTRGNAAVADRLEASKKILEADATAMTEAGLLPGKYACFSAGAPRMRLFSSSRTSVLLDTITQGLSGRKLGGMFNFRTRHSTGFGDNTDMLFEEISTLVEGGHTVLLMTNGSDSAHSLGEKLCIDGEIARVADTPVGSEIPFSILSPGTVLILPSAPVSPFELLTPCISVISASSDEKSQERHRSAKKNPSRKRGAERILSFNDLHVGDYVVHESHGIGIYEGMTTMNSGGMVRDYITIRYAGSDKLFLPVDCLDRVSKYIGAKSDDGTLALSKFGGREWDNTKRKTKAALKNIAKDLIQLYAERMRRPGFAFSPDDSYQKEFEDSFEFDETEAQLEAADDIKKDMMQARPMDRLLCGDVGYGKTEVAFRAIYKAILDGKQVAMLVPTTILALQHYQTALSRMRSFPVSIEMLSRFVKPKEQKAIMEKCAKGDVDLIIGTHRLLSKDIKFRDLGLLVIDEEQRFGVAQKEKLKQRSAGIDVLSLSATPIPRTLNMAMTGIRDISLLYEAPANRLPVQTYILEHDELIIHEAIRKELRRGGQVFYLYNFIDSIESAAARLREAIPEARITVAHGRMDKDEIEDIWKDMTEGSIDILVSTTIIESGIDLPNANTLIVTNAHRMGLSQLHQLRGRVGRSSRRAYAYFTFPMGQALSEISEKRLEAIREYAEFGAGFQIAMRDLELRGAGSVLGAEQSGHMDAVGYELYVKLLGEAVMAEKGEIREEKKETECQLSLKTDAHIPDRYIEAAAQRMTVYKRIAHITAQEDWDDIYDELTDRYGEPPESVTNLLDISLLRFRASKLGVASIAQNGSEIRIAQKDFDLESWQKLSGITGGRLRIAGGDTPCVIMRAGREKDVLISVCELFKKYSLLKPAEFACEQR
ncbi:MAG: transcription-repair coupling factor [Clostridia bacterium]|nr:transcription-repair coupling factor [Clostridia bacterium]